MGARRRVATRRHRWLAVSAAGSVLVAAILFSLHTYATIAIQSKARAALSARLGRGVAIAEVDLGWGAMALRGVTIDGPGEGPPTAEIERVVISYDVSDLFDKTLRVNRVDVYGVTLRVERDGAGRLDVDDILEHASRKRIASASGGSGFDVVTTNAPVELHDITVVAADEPTGTALELQVAHLTPTGRRRVEVQGASLVGRSQTARIASLLDNKPFVDVGGSIELDKGQLLVDLGGGFVAADSERWKAKGRVSLADQRATLVLDADQVRLDRLLPAHLASSIVDREGTTVTSSVEATITRNAISLAGELDIRNLDISHRRLARQSLEDVSFVASGTIDIDLEARRAITSATIESGQVTYELSASGQLPDSARSDHPQARLAMSLSMPTVRCQDMLESFPRSMLPDLAGFELEGELDAKLSLAIDWANIKKTELDGEIALEGCRVREAPERMSADRLRGSFEHRVPVGDEWMTYTVGPENPSFVPLRQVSRNLTRSLLTTEDSRFYRHKGFIGKQFRTALIKNLEAGYFRYGASSISMQVVKNVMLSREKTISRKLEELFLTWYLEKELSKDRILEIYVNAIEFGPGIYGIKPAARQYFNKHPRRLNPVESAFFSSILPAPTRRFKQYCRGWAGRWTNGKIDRILDIMLERNRLDEEQYLNAILTPLVFRGKRTEICRRYQETQKNGAKR